MNDAATHAPRQRRWRLSHKLSLLAIIFAVPVAIMLTLVFIETQRGIAMAAQERRGVEYLAELGNVLHKVQAHNLKAGGDGSSAEATIDTAIERIGAVDRRLGDEFATSERAQNLADHWRAMKKRQGALTPERSLMEHRALSEGIIDLMHFVAERSRLLLDPEARSAYLQNVSVSRLPEFIAATGHAGALLGSGTENQAQVAMTYQLAMKNHEAVNRGYVSAFGGSDVDVGDDRLNAARKALDASAAIFLEAASARIRGDASAIAPAASLRLASAALNDGARLHEATLSMLDAEIGARAISDRRLQVAMLALVGLSLGIAVFLLAMLWRSITGSVRQAVGLADRISEGDLTVRIARPSGDEIGDLVASLNRMSERVTLLVAGVKQSANEVLSSSQEVSRANVELSGRTERQAASLEEMAASTEELSAAVSQSAAKIQSATDLVGNAAKSSETSNRSMEQAMGTMQNIKQQSSRIAEISAVIDGIAFQTNILALNAAVEAARVGTEGRGFAVVAGEIRLLSHRSATAAREIKALIAQALAAIESGGVLVGDAGVTLASTLQSIGSAVAIMGDVSSMAREQSTSIEQVSSAVTELNGVTQQNAAFVQDNSTVAGRQESHAAALVRMVDAFRIEEDAGEIVEKSPGPAPSPRRRTRDPLDALIAAAL